MKVWFEGNRVFYDMVINGISPNWIEIPDVKIQAIKLIGKDLYIKGEPDNYIIEDITIPAKTTVVKYPQLRVNIKTFDELWEDTQIEEYVTIMDAGSSYYKERAQIVYTAPSGQIVVQYEDGMIEIMYESDIHRLEDTHGK